MPAKDVKAYVKRNKNDAADAAAICEAVRRPTMRFVEVKSAEQQGRLMQHRTRDLLLRQRTQTINALRAHMAELGIVAAQCRFIRAAVAAATRKGGPRRAPPSQPRPRAERSQGSDIAQLCRRADQNSRPQFDGPLK